MPNDRHVAIEPSRRRAPPLTPRSNAQDLRHPIRVHPTTNHRAALPRLRRARRRSAEHTALLALLLPVRAFLGALPADLVLAQDEALARARLRGAGLGRGDRVDRAARLELEVLFQVHLHGGSVWACVGRGDGDGRAEERWSTACGAKLARAVFADPVGIAAIS